MAAGTLINRRNPMPANTVAIVVPAFTADAGSNARQRFFKFFYVAGRTRGPSARKCHAVQTKTCELALERSLTAIQAFGCVACQV